MHQSGKSAFSLMPLIVLGCIVLASMIVTFLLYVSAGLATLPVTLAFLVLIVGGLALGGGLAAASLSRRGYRKGQK